MSSLRKNRRLFEIPYIEEEAVYTAEFQMNMGEKEMASNIYFIITVIVAGMVINFFFGLYNLKITNRIKSLTKPQVALILIISTMNTGNCLIHLLINMIIGAYKRN